MPDADAEFHRLLQLRVELDRSDVRLGIVAGEVDLEAGAPDVHAGGGWNNEIQVGPLNMVYHFGTTLIKLFNDSEAV